MTDKTKAYLLVLIGAVIGGLISTVTKIGLAEVDPFTFTFVRFSIASCIILPFFLKRKIHINSSLWSLVAISFLPIINIALFVWGVKLTTASIGAIVYAGTPILTGIFSYILLGDRMTLKKWFFLMIGLFGVLYIVLLPLFERGVYYAGDIRGNIFLLLGMTFWSLYLVISKKYQKKYSVFTIIAVFIFLSTFVFFIGALSESFNISILVKNISLNSWLAILYTATLGTIGGYLINQYKIKLAGPLVAALTFYLLPIIGYLAAFILLGEQLTPGLFLGTLFVLLSITLTTFSK